MEGDAYFIRTEHNNYETCKFEALCSRGLAAIVGCDQWCIYHCTHLACAQGPLKFLHSGVPKQTLKHLGNSQELFLFTLRDPNSLYTKGPINHKWRYVSNLLMHACVQTIGDLTCVCGSILLEY